MPAGKACSQAGHAYVGAILASGDRAKDYLLMDMGTKVCLEARDLDELMRIKAEADLLGIPNFLVEDTGRNTTFGGVPTISALGIGPIRKGELSCLAKLSLLR